MSCKRCSKPKVFLTFQYNDGIFGGVYAHNNKATAYDYICDRWFDFTDQLRFGSSFHNLKTLKEVQAIAKKEYLEKKTKLETALYMLNESYKRFKEIKRKDVKTITEPLAVWEGEDDYKGRWVRNEKI